MTSSEYSRDISGRGNSPSKILNSRRKSGSVRNLVMRIIEIVVASCQILRLKCTKFDFGWGSSPDPAGGAYSTPLDPISAFKGPTSRARREGKGRRGKDRVGKGRKVVVRGKGMVVPRAFLISLLPDVGVLV